MTSILSLDHVSRHFALPSDQRIDVLADVSFDLQAGEVVAIVGRSGSGKSTLLNVMGLLDRPSSGQVQIRGQRVDRLSEVATSRLRGREIGFVFQQFFLMDRRTALQNVAEPLLYGPRTEQSHREQRARSLLEQVGLSGREESTPNLLSGGEQQRVAIARALVRRPQIVLADEPTGALDEATGNRVLSMLLELARSEQVGLVLVTHDRRVADLADRVVTLSTGHLSGS